MPTLDLGQVVGPQGPQGATGPQGPQGVKGEQAPVINDLTTGGVTDALSAEMGKQLENTKADLTLSNLSNYQKALRNIGGRPNSNLLDNAYFKGGGSQQEGGQFPINQRGQTSYAGGYFIDRWFLNNTNEATVAANGITIKNTSNNYVSQQKRETSLPTGQAVTVSAFFSDGFLVYASGTVGDTITSSTHSDYYVQLENDGKIFSIVSIVQNASATIAAVKLELGSVQTLAYQDEDGNWQLFETPDYGEELAKCQRYYLPIDNRGRFPAVFLSPSTALQVFVPTPVTMRVNPTIQGITSISARVYSGAANSQSLSISQTLLTEAGVLITFSATWQATPNPYSCAIAVFGEDGALSAEL